MHDTNDREFQRNQQKKIIILKFPSENTSSYLSTVVS